MMAVSNDNEMTLRDQFAAQALAGIMANPSSMKVMVANGAVTGFAELTTEPRIIAIYAYQIADAMLEESNK